MKKKTKHFFIKEEGNVLMIFAASMILIAFFIGICLDLSIVYMEHNSMQSMLQIIREERFTFQETIRYADNPAVTTYKIVNEAAEKNGFEGKLKVYFYEEEPSHNYRRYQVRIVLTKESPLYFGKIFGLNTVTLNAGLDGGESYGEGFADIVWHPPYSVSVYNGSYSGKDGGGYVYDSSDLPPDW